VSHFDRRSSPRTTEKQDIAVGVLELETTQTVSSVFQWLGKLDIARSKFGRQCVRIRDVNECVPAGDTFFDVSLVVRQWSYANVFEQDLRTAPANDAEEDVVRSRPLEGDLKSKPVSVKRKRMTVRGSR
jgi:hypothetical protein